MTDFRALCEQLMELVEGKRYDGSAVVARARAALAEQPVEPTPIETVCYYDDPENLPYFVGN